jgi:C1A family cysteine protease
MDEPSCGLEPCVSSRVRKPGQQLIDTESNVESPRSKVKRHLGTGRDHVSPLDWKYRPNASVMRRLPAVVDLRRHCPPVYDQLHLNSCSANAIAAALRYDELKEGRPDVPSPSRLFIYYNERVLAGVVTTDSPVSLRDGYRTIAKVGTCPEALWPYQVRRFRRQPTPPCYRAAHGCRAIAYYRIRRAVSQMRACLADGYPFVMALAIHQSAKGRDVRRTGVLPVPTRGDRLLGGHAVLAVGYDHVRRLLLFRNSWGSGWGDHGYGYLPYAFVASSALTWDFWTMRRVS